MKEQGLLPGFSAPSPPIADSGASPKRPAQAEEALSPTTVPMRPPEEPGKPRALKNEDDPSLHEEAQPEARDLVSDADDAPERQRGEVRGWELEDDGWPRTENMLSGLVDFEPTAQPPAPITVLGVSHEILHGDAPLSDRDISLLRDAHVVCAGPKILESCLPKISREPLQAEIIPLKAPVSAVTALLQERRSEGKRVLVLADGDPLFFGIGATLRRQLSPEELRIVPAVSCLQQACARLGLPWHEVISISLHGRDDLAPLNRAVGLGRPVCILTDAATPPNAVARHLLDRGVDWFTASVFEEMGGDDEKISTLSLSDMTTAVFPPGCTIMLEPSDPPRRPRLGISAEELATEGCCMTALPVRAAALALLAIEPHHVVWDIGAGTGAVALEACALAKEGRVIAVEKRPARELAIRENRRRFGAAILDVCLGNAADRMAMLPDPHRVFVGGGLSGDDGPAILSHICRRLPEGGKVVAACVLLETFFFCRTFLEDKGWHVEIMQLQASKAAPLAGDAHLVASNPVFLVSARKPKKSPEGLADA